MDKSFAGVFAALTTPFVGEDISPEKFKENLCRYNQTGLSGYVVLGSTGEAVFLSDGEGEKLVKEAKVAAGLGKRLIVGTARESTGKTVEFTNRMAALGADAALIKPPHYYKSLMTGEALKEHYLKIADSSKLPIIIYNIPQNTGVAVDPPLVIELSRHPRIVGIKDSSGILANLGEVLPAVRQEFSFLLGAGSVFLAGLLLGASGGILAMAAAVPELCAKLYALFKAGKKEEAKKLQLNLVPLNKALTQTMGIPALKYALDLLGFYGGPCRSPLLPLAKKEKAAIRQMLDTLGLSSRRLS